MKDKKLKQSKLQMPESPVDWVAFVTAYFPRLAIPVGPRFQADVVDDILEDSGQISHLEPDASKWLGIQIWPNKGADSPTGGVFMVGRGRTDFCSCVSAGSTECAERHISEERAKIKLELGPAFWDWRFSEMGDEAFRNWTLKEERTFESLVKTSSISQGMSFLKLAMETFPLKEKKDIVGYYFNVFVPRRICMITRLGAKLFDSDDDDDHIARGKVNVKDSRKRYPLESKHPTSRYLSGLR